MRALYFLAQIFALMLGEGYPAQQTQAAPPAASQAVHVREATDVCSLLDASEIREVQGDTLRETKQTEENRSEFTTQQCFYQTTNFSRSVSLTVIRPGANHPDGARAYWRQRFHAENQAARAADGKGEGNFSNEAPPKKEQPPRPIAELGDEAFWAGNQIAGALYVLQGDLFVRLSVGGPGEEGQKIEKSKELARRALGRVAEAQTSARE